MRLDDCGKLKKEEDSYFLGKIILETFWKVNNSNACRQENDAELATTMS